MSFPPEDPARLKVIIADDDAVSRSILQRALQKMGLQVTVTSNGQDALEAVRAGMGRLVITDWEMPELDGLELCQAVRRSPMPGYVYVILLTQRQDRQDIIQGLDAGADDFLVKPFNLAELRVRIRAGQRVLTLQSRDMTIFAMAKLAEARDPETGAHLERTRSYARVLAQHLRDHNFYPDDVNDEFVHMIYLTSPLHDIGKVAIPDCVLLKQGKLSDAEFEVMKTHTHAGAATIDAALMEYPDTPFLNMAREIIISHHERWDGTGYPHGLKGQAIPLSGRIMSVADVYDALVSKRVYKAALSHHVARAMIIEQRERQFDPTLVDAFIATEQQFIEVHDRYNDSEGEGLRLAG